MNEFFDRAYNNAQLWKIDPMATGEQLYRYRRKNNLAQEGLSELIDACGKSASRVVISKWENGSKTPSLLHLMFLSELYNCSLDELVVSYRCSKERELDDRDQPVPLKITYFIKTNVCVCICSSFFVNLRFLGTCFQISIIKA